MSENRQINSNLRNALSNLAQEARNLLDNYDDISSSAIERQLLHSTPTNNIAPVRESARGTNAPNTVAVSSNTSNITHHLVANRPSYSLNQSASSVSSINTSPNTSTNTGRSRSHRRSEDVPAALRRSFPTLASKRSSKSFRKPPEKKTRKSTIVYKDLILLPTATTRTVPTHQTRCQLENNGFVIHGCPIDKSWEEPELKHKIKEWFPILEENDIDFDFVKSCYGQIVTPKLAAGVKFTAARALSLSGQGSIYIRPKEDISNENDDADLLGEGNGNAEYSDNSYIESSSLASTSQEQVLMPPQIPCSSSPTHQEDLNRLKEMFPNTSYDALGHALLLHGTVDKAALSLSAIASSQVSISDDDEDDEIISSIPLLPQETSLSSILKGLEEGLSKEKEKLRVEEEDLFNDALCYYKDPNFDEKKRLRIVYQGQPAVDTGGVTRQFFTKLLSIISEMFFEGCVYKSPIYNADVVASGMMKYIGTIIVHSILQGGPAFPVFSPSVYEYLSTGDFELAMKTANIGECSAHMNHFINQVWKMGI